MEPIQNSEYEQSIRFIKNLYLLFYKEKIEITEKNLSEIYKKLSKKCHPDSGGNVALMVSLNQFNEYLKTFFLNSNKPSYQLHKPSENEKKVIHEYISKRLFGKEILDILIYWDSPEKREENHWIFLAIEINPNLSEIDFYDTLIRINAESAHSVFYLNSRKFIVLSFK